MWFHLPLAVRHSSADSCWFGDSDSEMWGREEGLWMYSLSWEENLTFHSLGRQHSPLAIPLSGNSVMGKIINNTILRQAEPSYSFIESDVKSVPQGSLQVKRNHHSLCPLKALRCSPYLSVLVDHHHNLWNTETYSSLSVYNCIIWSTNYFRVVVLRFSVHFLACMLLPIGGIEGQPPDFKSSWRLRSLVLAPLSSLRSDNNMEASVTNQILMLII